MSSLKLTADGGGGTVAIKGPASTTGNNAFELTVPGTASGTILTSNSSVGKILQIQQLFKNDAVSATGSSETSFNDISGMSLAITPSSSSNKILVSYSIRVSSTPTGRNNSIRLVRGSTVIGAGTGGSTANATEHFRQMQDTNGNIVDQCSFEFLDSPATTSETTYKLQWTIESGTAYLNRRGDAGGSSSFGLGSTITLKEVAA